MIQNIKFISKNIIKYFLIIWISFVPPIAVHELGHFVVAKLTNLETTELSLGFGPGISTKINNDTYSLRIIPLGGFVKLQNENTEIYHKEHLLTLMMGPINNIIFAFLCFFIYYYKIFQNMQIIKEDEHSIIFKFRNNYLFKYLARDTFETSVSKDEGIFDAKEVPLNNETTKYSTKENVRKGAWFAFKKINMFIYKDKYFKDLSRIFFVKEINQPQNNKSSGPIGIVQDAAKHINRSFLSLIYFVGEISLSVGILNLLPIYPLDGGKLWPIVLKLKDSAEVVQTAPELSSWQIIGLFLVLGFFTYIFLRDIGVSIKKIYIHWRKK